MHDGLVKIQPSRLIGVDIPPDVDLTTIRHFLISTNLVWEHADPTYDDLFPGEGAAV